MNYTFDIRGVHGKHCTDKIINLLSTKIQAKSIQFDPTNTKLSFNSELNLTLIELNELLATAGNYQVTKPDTPNTSSSEMPTSYKPIYLIFAYLIITNYLIILPNLSIDRFMLNFMASFFLIFSFFKLLDVKGFAEGYASYDIIAKQVPVYGYLYPFIELGFGLSYIYFGANLYLNILVLIIMLISTIGVIKAKLSKQKFQCACVGTFLKVPLSNIAIIEDLLMVLMSLFMILRLTHIL